MLTEAQYEALESMAKHAARVHYSSPMPGWGFVERYDAALDGIIEYIAEHGWTEERKPLFYAAANGIADAAYEWGKHKRNWARWIGTPSNVDTIAEAVTDKIGIHQLSWAFPDGEWAVVCAMATAIEKGDDYHRAAASIGLGDAVFRARLYRARKRAFQLWVPPDETPVGRYAPYKRGARSTMRSALDNRRAKEAA